ncbi:hypothetical protein HDU85_001217 [Gaertneriomyces sp. JEL0708]|nr:hypothetical protein HDU85_001217 [Gaertneriomyces sp. JEL0708]
MSGANVGRLPSFEAALEGQLNSLKNLWSLHGAEILRVRREYQSRIFGHEKENETLRNHLQDLENHLATVRLECSREVAAANKRMIWAEETVNRLESKLCDYEVDIERARRVAEGGVYEDPNNTILALSAEVTVLRRVNKDLRASKAHAVARWRTLYEQRISISAELERVLATKQEQWSRFKCDAVAKALDKTTPRSVAPLQGKENEAACSSQVSSAPTGRVVGSLSPNRRRKSDQVLLPAPQVKRRRSSHSQPPSSARSSTLPNPSSSAVAKKAPNFATPFAISPKTRPNGRTSTQGVTRRKQPNLVDSGERRQSTNRLWAATGSQGPDESSKDYAVIAATLTPVRDEDNNPFLSDQRLSAESSTGQLKRTNQHAPLIHSSPPDTAVDAVSGTLPSGPVNDAPVVVGEASTPAACDVGPSVESMAFFRGDHVSQEAISVQPERRSQTSSGVNNVELATLPDPAVLPSARQQMNKCAVAKPQVAGIDNDRAQRAAAKPLLSEDDDSDLENIENVLSARPPRRHPDVNAGSDGRILRGKLLVGGPGLHDQANEERISRPSSARTAASKAHSTTVKGNVPYKYAEVVRNKEVRKKMHAQDCPCCNGFYKAAGPIQPHPELGAPSATERDHIQSVSRHRHWHKPPDTPPGYWEVGFPTTQQVAAYNEAAKTKSRT